MIDGALDLARCGRQSWQRRSAERTLVAIVMSKSSAVASSACRRRFVPTLLTKTSSCPEIMDIVGFSCS